RLGVHRVLGADQDGVGHPAPAGQFLPGGEDPVVGEGVAVGEAAAACLRPGAPASLPTPAELGALPAPAGG
ncbi:MAG TPA: hypothetical protein VHS79_08975, partial [Actinomycetes bacterium]|nr:hypothetical protein [Actinomycetes bacterium]